MVEVYLDMYRLLFFNSYRGACLHRIRILGSKPIYVSSIKYNLTNQKLEELETALQRWYPYHFCIFYSFPPKGSACKLIIYAGVCAYSHTNIHICRYTYVEMHMYACALEARGQLHVSFIRCYPLHCLNLVNH